MNQNRRKGLRYEDRAREFLSRQGLSLVQANYQCRFGEIDLIMQERATLCFIEVKFRRSLAFGGAAGSISLNKQRKLVKSALCFIRSRQQYERMALRFDALLIQQQQDRHQFDWIRNAFYAE